jgi:hypothetical protein
MDLPGFFERSITVLRVNLVRCVCAIVLLCSPAALRAADVPSGQATGSLTIDGKPLQLHYAIAITGPDTFDETKEAVMVLLTPKPVTQASIDKAATFDDMRSLADEGIAYKARLGDHFHLTARHPILNGKELQTSGSMTDSKIEVGATAVTGNIVPWGGKEEDMFEHKVSYDVAFNAPIARRFALDKLVVMSPNAKKLGTGGGAAGKAWIDEKCSAPKIPKDPKEAEAMLAKEGALPSDAELKKQHTTRAAYVKDLLELANAMADLQTTDCKVFGGLEEGDYAIIQVEGTSVKMRQQTDVTMVKDSAKGWKVKKEGAWRVLDQKK